MNTKSIGEITEAVILAHLLKKGWSVSLPFGDNQRYDMIIDTGGGLLRAQCKTARWVNGCIEFAASSKNGFTGTRKPYTDQIDTFLIYSPKTQKVYMVPVNNAGTTVVRLRVEANNGGAVSYIKWASDYEI